MNLAVLLSKYCVEFKFSLFLIEPLAEPVLLNSILTAVCMNWLLAFYESILSLYLNNDR
jgi:hypothetical protein